MPSPTSPGGAADLFRELVAASLLPHTEIDVSDGVAATTDRIAAWLKQTGGLYLAS